MWDGELTDRVAAVRGFNRFYTRQIGVLTHGLLGSPFSLTEVRVLYELAHGGGGTVVGLARGLGLDAGYVSRMVRGFEKQGLLAKMPSPSDGRQTLLSLTAAGTEALAALEERSDALIGELLQKLSAGEQRRLVEAMGNIRALLGEATRPGPLVLRSHRPGDMGWVVQRHGAVYAEEHGWDETFEALVAEIVAGFIRNLDPARERCWIAERAVGTAFWWRCCSQSELNPRGAWQRCSGGTLPSSSRVSSTAVPLGAPT
jgi:DNA-binding MarR family transcriptional regulator